MAYGKFSSDMLDRPFLDAAIGLSQETLAVAAVLEDEAEGAVEERLEAVEISGEVGEEPEVAWSSQMTAGKVEAETLVTGEGAKLEEGDQVTLTLHVLDE